MENLPNEYKPLGAWTYFGYQLLFAVPLVGLIFLIVFSFDNSNINRRNFARSYWCSYILAAIFIIIAAILGFSFFAAVTSAIK